MKLKVVLFFSVLFWPSWGMANDCTDCLNWCDEVFESCLNRCAGVGCITACLQQSQWCYQSCVDLECRFPAPSGDPSTSEGFIESLLPAE